MKNLLPAAIATVAVLMTACVNDAQPRTAADYADDLGSKVTVDAMMGHLQRLQDIADANGGNRATGNPGFDRSVEFVAETLRSKGFDVTMPEFDMEAFRAKSVAVTVAGLPVAADAIWYTTASPPGGASGPLVAARPGETPGCTAADYAGLDVRGAVVLVDRGGCFFIEKAHAAADAGAVALVVANNDDAEVIYAGMSPGDDSRIPVVGVTKVVGQQLRRNPGPATVAVDSAIVEITTRSVIAQTTTGNTANVVMVGGHLDSVETGPGINDNGTGVAAILETALQMGSSPDVTNAVRFAFWAGEEEGLFGSLAYLRALDVEALKDIALYLNFDMLGSPNTCYFTSDGNQSAPPDPEIGLQLIPEGSPGIERELVASLEAKGPTPEDAPFDARSDYDSFTRAGIPVGNLDTGADELKTAEQAEAWGGDEGVACDPYYHSAKDTIDNVSRDALGNTGHVVASLTGRYAMDQTGRNGVPVRDDRTRHVPE